MKWSEFFSSAITGAREAGIEIEADEPKTEDKPAATHPVDAALNAQAQAQIDAQLTALDAANARIAALESEARTAKHSALAAGWAGDKATHLAMLAALEGNETLFAAYTAQQASAAEVLRQSGLFDAKGSDRTGGASAWEQMDSKARALMADEKGLTKAQAIVRIAESNPDLYAQYQAEN